MPYYFFDYWYILLVLPAVILAGIAQWRVRSAFNKYGKLGTVCHLTGEQVSARIQRHNGLQLPIYPVNGEMTDYYDPKSNTIHLSEPVYASSSVAAIGVAAHETGHALQYAAGYVPVKLRTAIYPTTRFASSAAPYLVIAGLLFSIQPLAYAGILLFALACVFQLITLPVEFNASARAMQALREDNTLTESELVGVKKVLRAAAMTYVASLFLSLMSLLRLLLIVAGRSGRRK